MDMDTISFQTVTGTWVNMSVTFHTDTASMNSQLGKSMKASGNREESTDGASTRLKQARQRLKGRCDGGVGEMWAGEWVEGKPKWVQGLANSHETDPRWPQEIVEKVERAWIACKRARDVRIAITFPVQMLFP